MDLTYLTQYKTDALSIINGIIVPVVVGIAFLMFVWGVYKYFILGADSESEKAEGRKFVFWAVIGFVAIFSVWGLVGLFRSTLGFDNAGVNAPAYPQL